MVCTELPGIRWGSRKFTVMATHAVTTYTASLRVMAVWSFAQTIARGNSVCRASRLLMTRAPPPAV